jgi:hypothetical protein
MAHKWDYGAIVGTTWHGQQLERGKQLTAGVTTKEGLELSRISEVTWTKIPVFAELSNGLLHRLDGQYLLERGPRPWVQDDEVYVLPRQVSEEFEIVQGGDLADLAQKVSDRTGWPFMSAAHLSNSEIAYVQLEIDKPFTIGGKHYEEHKAKLFFGDDKNGGSTFGGITYTRIQCWNTWRAALSGSGVWKLRHDNNPLSRLDFIAEKCVGAHRAMAEEERWLNAFFAAHMPEHLFERFVQETFPDPRVTEAMIEAEMAREMVQTNTTESDLSAVIDRGERSKYGYEQRLKLARERRVYMERAWEDYNGAFVPSGNDTHFYGGFQALTQTTSHGPFRDKEERGAMFGIRADYNDKGMGWLKTVCAEEGHATPDDQTGN